MTPDLWTLLCPGQVRKKHELRQWWVCVCRARETGAMRENERGKQIGLDDKVQQTEKVLGTGWAWQSLMIHLKADRTCEVTTCRLVWTVQTRPERNQIKSLCKDVICYYDNWSSSWRRLRKVLDYSWRREAVIKDDTLNSVFFTYRAVHHAFVI